MKTIKTIIAAIIASLATFGGVLLSYSTAMAPEETTVLAFTTDEKEDVKVSEIVLDKIHEEVNITSKTYEFSFVYEKGVLGEGASMSEKFKHALSGKSIAINALLSAELKSNLLNLSMDYIVFDETDKSLYILLPAPVISVHLDKEKTMVNDSFEAIFSSGYSEQEQLRMYYEIELIGEKKFREEKLETIETAKQDIINGLKILLEPIESVDTIVIDFQNTNREPKSSMLSENLKKNINN